MEEESVKETCACSSLDWTGHDLTAPHHPNCNAFVAARARLTDLPPQPDPLRVGMVNLLNSLGSYRDVPAERIEEFLKKVKELARDI
jgi:hypothetical protein